MKRLTLPQVSGLTRRGFVGAAAGAGVGALAYRGAFARVAEAAPAAPRRFATHPAFDPPPVAVRVPAAGTAAGHVFLAPFDFASGPIPAGRYGPLIVGDDGEPIWFLPLSTIVAQNLAIRNGTK